MSENTEGYVYYGKYTVDDSLKVYKVVVCKIVVKCFGEYSFERYKIPYYSALMVERYCPALSEEEHLNVEPWNEDVYERLLTLLFPGKACDHLEDDEKYAWVRGYYDKMKYVGNFRNKQ